MNYLAEWYIHCCSSNIKGINLKCDKSFLIDVCSSFRWWSQPLWLLERWWVLELVFWFNYKIHIIQMTNNNCVWSVLKLIEIIRDNIHMFYTLTLATFQLMHQAYANPSIFMCLFAVKTVPRSKSDAEVDSRGRSMPVPTRSSSLKPSAKRSVSSICSNPPYDFDFTILQKKLSAVHVGQWRKKLFTNLTNSNV